MTVPLDVANGQRVTEMVAGLRGAGNIGAVLAEDLVLIRVEPRTRPVNDVDEAGVSMAADRAVRAPDGLIDVSVAVEVVRLGRNRHRRRCGRREPDDAQPAERGDGRDRQSPDFDAMLQGKTSC